MPAPRAAGRFALPQAAAALAVTIIRLRDTDAAEALYAHLHLQEDLWVERIDAGQFRVSVLGSYAMDSMRLELDLRLRAWEAAEHARGSAVVVEIEDE
jgi:hypothetical protein